MQGRELAEAVGWARFGRVRGWPTPPVRLGRYELRRTLGHGGMGHVFAAWDPELARCVALKVLDRVDSEALALARHEARCLARLAHPNVVCVHEVGEAAIEGLDRGELAGSGEGPAAPAGEDRRAYVAMELIEGAGLGGGLQAEGPGRARTSWRSTLDCLLAAGRGLAAIHDAGLVHGDFKTGNVLVGDDGIVRVIDLGLACEPRRKHQGDRDQGPFFQTGTVPFMAPERLEGGPADAAGDQWGFCVTAWEMLFEALPFGRWTTPEPILAAIASGRLARARGPRARGRARTALGWRRVEGPPAEIERVLRRGLAEDPASRPRSMNELLALLERAAEAPKRRRSLAARVALAATFALMVAGLGELGHERSRCARAVVDLDHQWNAVARVRLGQRFMTADLPAPRADFEWVAGRLDRWASQWRDAWSSACVGECEAEAECLLRQRADFSALLELLLDPSAELLHAARSLVVQLDPPGLCGREGDDDEVLELAAGERRLMLALEAGALTRAREELTLLERSLESMPAGELRERSSSIVDRWRARLAIEQGGPESLALAAELLRDALDRAALAGPALEDVRLALLFERLRLHARSEAPSLDAIRDDGSSALSLVERSGSAALHMAWAQAYGEALAQVDADAALALLEPTLEHMTRSRLGSARLRLSLLLSVAELFDRAGRHEQAAPRWRTALALAESLHGKPAIELVPVLRGVARNAMARHDAAATRDAVERLHQLLEDSRSGRTHSYALWPHQTFSGSMHE